MADSAFWRDLAEQFLATKDSLHAGGASDYMCIAVETLAKRGASEIASADAPDLLGIWFEECRKAGYSFQVSGQSNEVSSADELAQSLSKGYIDGMCEASATFCKRLEAKAVEAEFEEKQRNVAETRTTAGRRQLRPPDKRKELIASLRGRQSIPNARKVCESIDKMINTTPIYKVTYAPLESLQSLAPSERSWVGFYDHPKTHNLVRRYVNGVPPLKTSK